MNNFCDFNNADDQNNFELIPKGTIAKVKLTIKSGGYNNHPLGITGGLAAQNTETGSIFLKCEYVILNTKYIKRKVWSLIGIKSNKGVEWGNQGRSYIKAILNSAHGFKSSDNSEEAQQARKLTDLSELNGITFLARIDVEKDQNGADKNVIKTAVTPDNEHYYDNENEVVVPVMGDGTPIANSAPIIDDDDIPF